VLDTTFAKLPIPKPNCLLPNTGESPSNRRIPGAAKGLLCLKGRLSVRVEVFKALQIVLDATFDEVPIPKPDCLLPNTGESRVEGPGLFDPELSVLLEDLLD